MNPFFFIHIPRTGGTAVRHTLQKYTAEDAFSNHLSATEMIAQAGEQLWKDRFTFSIVRNPYTRLVSLYRYIKGNSAHHLHKAANEHNTFVSFVQWIYSCEEPVFKTQKDFLCSMQGDILVDFVCRFESIHADVRAICNKIGCPFDLPKGPALVDIAPFYDDATILLVQKMFHDDFEIFGYMSLSH